MSNQYGLEFSDMCDGNYMAGGVKHTYRIKRIEGCDNSMSEHVASADDIELGAYVWFSDAKQACNEHNDKLATEDKPAVSESNDVVNNPQHYTQFPIELKDWNFGVVKDTITNKHWAMYFKTCSEYLHRAALKNGVKDLEKCVFWLNEAIARAKSGEIEIK